MYGHNKNEFNSKKDLLGLVADQQYEAGYHSVRWDGKDNNGNVVSSAIYLYQIQAGDFTQVKKISLLR